MRVPVPTFGAKLGEAEIDFPVSENKMNRHNAALTSEGKVVHRRFKTREYKLWQEKAAYQIKCQIRPVTAFPIQAVLTVFEGNDFNLARDVANFEKGVVDALVASGVIPGDNVKRVDCNCQQFFRTDRSKPARFFITLYGPRPDPFEE